MNSTLMALAQATGRPVGDITKMWKETKARLKRQGLSPKSRTFFQKLMASVKEQALGQPMRWDTPVIFIPPVVPTDVTPVIRPPMPPPPPEEPESKEEATIEEEPIKSEDEEVIIEEEPHETKKASKKHGKYES